MANPNIYHAVVFDLHPKIKEFLDSLDTSRQIDHDETNTPHVVAIEMPGPSVRRCIFMRNGKPENFVLHTRRRASPIQSWDVGDGFARSERVDSDNPRKERERQIISTYESIVRQILDKEV